MTLYTVNAPPTAAGGAAPEPASLVFVKEGFSWPALFIPELWLIFRRMWLVLVLYVAVALLLVELAARLGDALPVFVVILARFLFALEANGLRRWTLERNGYALIAVIEGRGRDEAERRFFGEWLGEAPAAASPPAPPVPPAASAASAPRAEPWKPTPENGGVVGLFPAPGGSA